MKTFNYALLAIMSACVFWSCSTQQYYQISQTTPVDQSTVKSDNDDKGYYYEDSNCRISYNFWSEKGNAAFTVTNLTDQVLYVVKDKCFFIKDGVSHDYFHGTEWVEPIVTGKTTAHTKEQRLLGIAPHSSRTIGEYVIYPYIFVDCDLDRKPMSNKPATMVFSPATTPVLFGNYITYKIGEKGDEKSVTNMFYTSRVTNYRMTDIFYTEKMEVCPNVSDIKMQQDSIMRFAPTTGYYIKYTK